MITTDVILGGARLHVSFTGLNNKKPTIVFLHDSLGCTTLWRDFPAALSDTTQYDVLMYDRQGYGRSDAFSNHTRNNNYMELEAVVLNELLQELHVKNAILFGHSDGGSIALIAASKYPDRVAGVITEGAHICVEDLTLDGIRRAKEAYDNTDLKTRLQKYHGDKTDAMFYAWADTWLKPSFRNWNISDFLPGITCPLLVIQGEDDEYGTLKQVNDIIAGISGRAEELIISGVGHTPHKEARNEVLSGSASFINSILKST